jgi:hypothetical protein
MPRFPIRSLIFLNVVFLNLACSQYRYMQKIKTDESCVLLFKPDFVRATYKISVDVVGKHISGLLVMKQMPDSSTRIVFTNEMGFSFFDFGFLPHDRFMVYQIVPQMNKKALVKTLRKDFDLILFRSIDSSKYYALADSNLVYHAFPQSSGINFYITDTHCSQLIKMQRSSNKKPVMEAQLYDGSGGNTPDSISIRHLNFNFSISLKKIPALAPQ